MTLTNPMRLLWRASGSALAVAVASLAIANSALAANLSYDGVNGASHFNGSVSGGADVSVVSSTINFNLNNPSGFLEIGFNVNGSLTVNDSASIVLENSSGGPSVPFPGGVSGTGVLETASSTLTPITDPGSSLEYAIYELNDLNIPTVTGIQADTVVLQGSGGGSGTVSGLPFNLSLNALGNVTLVNATIENLNFVQTGAMVGADGSVQGSTAGPVTTYGGAIIGDLTGVINLELNINVDLAGTITALGGLVNENVNINDVLDETTILPVPISLEDVPLLGTLDLENLGDLIPPSTLEAALATFYGNLPDFSVDLDETIPVDIPLIVENLGDIGVGGNGTVLTVQPFTLDIGVSNGSFDFSNIDYQLQDTAFNVLVPEPSSITLGVLAGVGLVAVGVRRRRRR